MRMNQFSETIHIGGDLPVHRLGFGAMRLTPDRWPTPAEKEHGIAVARRALELGVTLIDTADSYSYGANEELLAEALHPYPDNLVIATKAGQSRPDGAWRPLGRPEYLKQQAELSLRRLRLDRIDLFQLHRIDPQVPFDDQIGALKEMRDSGMIRHIGLSEVGVAEIERARRIVDIVSVQNLYNVADRRHEAVVDYCEKNGIAFIPWLPVANGSHASSTSPVAALARELGATPIQAALAWQLHRSPVIVPIPGTKSAEHLAENMAAANLRLTEAQLAAI
ncbi:aldo/keto reductase [Stackebrandtia nassauensis DSM 44728]|uniref:Aldo/keto reductase n=2 Tax=Stackebrandtia TaxID=283810 RepID=D3Q6E9_STANL|nr:aldo/keto reductase [Stackebrandtia nassauensis DSM 44728]